MIDLHCHSTSSDGALTPTELVELALTKGISALALTDHDTVEGLGEFLRAAEGRPLHAIPGVEVACIGCGKRIMHIVGLWVDAGHRPLLDLLAVIRQRRQERNLLMLDRLRALGCPVELGEVEAAAAGGVLGRPHFAQALVSRGFCQNPRDAFNRYLARGKSAYVPRQLTSVEDTLAVLGQAGAVTIWAHPLTSSSISGAKFRREVRQLTPLGLDGIEVYYSEYTDNQTRNARSHAQDTGVLQSGGSDFHGANIPGIDLGVGRGNLLVPDSLLEPLEARSAAKMAKRRGPLSVPRSA